MKIYKSSALRILSLIIAFAGGVAAMPAQAQAPQVAENKTPVYLNKSAPLEARVNDLMARLTLEEKISLVSGTGFGTSPIPRLGVPGMEMMDAGQGARGGSGSTQGPATAFPSGVALASTWNPALVGRIGKAIGEEARNKGTGAQVLLAPAVNIQRTPQGGRNGEYMSEDPFLAARLGVDYIRGVQSAGVAACVKHYVANNQETDRLSINAIIGERALREIYLPAFKAAVQEGKPWALMTAYNRINGPHASANWYLDTQILRNEWGFDGLTMSDWGGVHAVAETLNAGNDLEMPGGRYLTPSRVKAAIANGELTPQIVDQSARRIVRAIVRVGLLDGPIARDATKVNSDEHRALALEAARQSLVLLKNEKSVLPLDKNKIKSLAVIGMGAQNWNVGVDGSARVQPLRSTGPLAGLTQSAGANVKVSYAAGISEDIPQGTLVPATAFQTDGEFGLKTEIYSNAKLEGAPAATRTDEKINFDWTAAPAPGVARTNFSARFTGKIKAPVTGRTTLILSGDDGFRMSVDGKKIIDNWKAGARRSEAATFDMQAGYSYDVNIEYFQLEGDSSLDFKWALPGEMPADPAAQARDEAVALAKNSDAAVVVVQAGAEGEGNDRKEFGLPSQQDELIAAVARANPRTIVVLNNGTPVEISKWLSDVPAVIEAWMPGQEGGAALGEIVFGDVNPSGHLSNTAGAARTDYPDLPNFPGDGKTVRYEEGIYVGYRHFDKRNIKPLFPFGYGLSYTTFSYSDIKVAPTLAPGAIAIVSAKITNTGARAGAEVVQLYVHDVAPKVDRAPRELKGFARVQLAPGQSQTVTFPVSARDLSYCDVAGKQWKANAGNYEIEVGASSRDLRLKAPLRLTRDWTEKIVGMGAISPYKPVAPQPSLATGKTATASSVVNEKTSPALAFDLDANENTRWESGWSDAQWLAVGLGAPQTVARVKLQWEDAYASAFEIQISDDGQNWTPVYTTDSAKGGTQNLKFAPVKTRYVRVWMTKRATPYGYSIYDMGVYGS